MMAASEPVAQVKTEAGPPSNGVGGHHQSPVPPTTTTTPAPPSQPTSQPANPRDIKVGFFWNRTGQKKHSAGF